MREHAGRLGKGRRGRRKRNEGVSKSYAQEKRRKA